MYPQLCMSTLILPENSADNFSIINHIIKINSTVSITRVGTKFPKTKVFSKNKMKMVPSKKDLFSPTLSKNPSTKNRKEKKVRIIASTTLEKRLEKAIIVQLTRTKNRIMRLDTADKTI